MAMRETLRNHEVSHRRQPPREVTGVQAEFLDFEDRSSGLVEFDDIADTLAEGRFVWIDVDCEQARPEVIAEMLPAQRPGRL